MFQYLLPQLQLGFWILFSVFSSAAHAAKVGDALSSLSFESQPYDFHYAANGQPQLITIYPAKPSSMGNADFNVRVQKLGICPLAITDIFHRIFWNLTSVEKSKIINILVFFHYYPIRKLNIACRI